MSSVVIDEVIEEQLDGRATLPANEVKNLIIEYEKDIRNERNKINEKKEELKQVVMNNL